MATNSDLERTVMGTASGLGAANSLVDCQKEYYRVQQALTLAQAAAAPIATLQQTRFTTVSAAPSLTDKEKEYLISKLALSAAAGAVLSVSDLNNLWFNTTPVAP
jgi:hypothetical protein